MRIHQYLIAGAISLFGCALLSLSTVQAEQIKLKDGRFIQGKVVESDDDGFKFEITSTKGLVRLAWSQISEKDAKRLRKSDSSDEIDLKILVEGIRLTQKDGSQLEGIGAKEGNVWILTNLSYPNGREFKPSDLEELNAVEEGVQLDAFTIWDASKVIEKELEDNPPEDAKAWYRIALIAEAHDLYADALGYLEQALESTPDETLKATIEAHKPELEDLVEQAEALEHIAAANDFVAKKKFGEAIAILRELKKDVDKGSVIDQKIDEILERIDLSFTLALIKDFHKALPKEISSWVRKNKKASLQDSGAFIASSLTDLVLAQVAGDNYTTNEEVQRRLMLRLGDSEEAFEIRKELRSYKASFGKKGWYQSVGGPLPNSGNIAREAPGGNNGRRGRDGDGIAEKEEFQAGNGKAKSDRIRKEQIEDILKKIAEENKEAADKAKAEADRRENTPAGYSPDDPRLKVPKNTPSLTDYWKKLSTSSRSRWLLAAYVRTSGLIWRDESKRTYEVVVYR